MALLTDLRQEVLPNVADCPIPVVDKAIAKAAIEFCNRSRAWRFTPDDIPILAGIGDYLVPDLPEGAAIAWLMSADLDGNPVDVRSAGALPKSWASETGAPEAAVVVGEASVGLRKVPSSSGALVVLLSLRPSLNATEYPDDLHSLYQDAIASGVLARLYAMPKKPWSALELVRDCRDRFESAISEAEYRADRELANSPAATSLCLVGGR